MSIDVYVALFYKELETQAIKVFRSRFGVGGLLHQLGLGLGLGLVGVGGLLH